VDAVGIGKSCKPSKKEGNRVRPETEAERAARHARTLAAYRALIDPAAPPREPFLLEHHFVAGEEGDVTGLTRALEEMGYQIDTVAYDPDHPARAWKVVALKVDLLAERRLLALSDELDDLARRHDAIYDGWLTRVEK
jgi:regulator of RNase E activity RraB